MKFEQKYEIEEVGGLVLTPQGSIEDLIFNGGMNQCGTAYYGVSMMREKNAGSEVLTLDDCVRLRDFLNNHLRKVFTQPSVSDSESVATNN